MDRYSSAASRDVGSQGRYCLHVTRKEVKIVWAGFKKGWEWLGKKLFGLAVEGARPRSRPNKTWKEVADTDVKCLHLRASDELDCKKWRNLLRGKQSHGDDKSGDSDWCVLSTDLLLTHPGRPGATTNKRVCCWCEVTRIKAKTTQYHLIFLAQWYHPCL